MTTIVVRDGKTLLIDTCISSEVGISLVNKVFWGPNKEWMAFGAGQLSSIEKCVQAYATNTEVKMGFSRKGWGSVSFFFKRKGDDELSTVFYEYDRAKQRLVLDKVGSPGSGFSSAGSGAYFLIGAVQAGATTKEATVITASLDTATNDKFVAYDLVTFKRIKLEDF